MFLKIISVFTYCYPRNNLDMNYFICKIIVQLMYNLCIIIFTEAFRGNYGNHSTDSTALE